MRELVIEEVHSVSGGGVVDVLGKIAVQLGLGVAGNYVYDQLKSWLSSQPDSEAKRDVSTWMESDGATSTGLSCTRADAMVYEMMHSSDNGSGGADSGGIFEGEPPRNPLSV
jgi:hypothetical protein